MLLSISGLVLLCGAFTMIWYFKPRHGQVHRLVVMPFLESTVPITITGLAALGLAMMVAGLLR